ncbi:hypothetical protein AMECASPLE_017489 [Ameca splendens]|uniref:Uncharacterized protein n=1 Tax=Ameca splendens TaxID=208324 RepID=A0ABV0Y2Y1_9TELE
MELSPNRAQGTRPQQAATGSELAHIKHPAPDTENHKYTSGQRHQPPAGSVAGRKSPELILEREQSKTHPDTKNRHIQSQSHIPTHMHTHKNTYTYESNVKTNKNGRHTLTHTPLPILHRSNQPPDLGGGPLPSGVGDRQTAPAPEPGLG